MQQGQNKKNLPLLGLNIIISSKADVVKDGEVPIIELRRTITDIDTIKQILSCAYHKKPIEVLPRFHDETRALCTMQEKGFVCRVPNREGKLMYEFLI